MADKNDLRSLTEPMLVSNAIPDSGWSDDLAALPDKSVSEIRSTLAQRLKSDELKDVLFDLKRAFSDAVEMALLECKMRQRSDEQSSGGKKPSSKLGIHLRTEVQNLRADLEGGANPDARDFCNRILEKPELEHLITPFLEDRIRGDCYCPLRNSPSLAIAHLPQVLELIHDSISRGVTTGRTESALTFLAGSVVNAVFRATGKAPGRTWDEYNGQEQGVGLKTSRILAAALNEALPEGCRRSRSADMVKPFRRAIEARRKGD